jgi:5-methyltetrahydrofolate corrinoid/iron sulfur protein methyltransferase
MEVIGERINTSIKYIERAYQEKDAKVIQEEAKKQVEAGVDIIDVNAGLKLENNVERLEWAVDVVQAVTDIPLAIDSIHPKAIEAGLRRCRDIERCIANSITLQRNRIDGILPFVKEMGCKVVGVTIDEKGGMPDYPEGRLEIAKKLADAVDDYGIDLSLLYIDFMCLPVSVPNWYRQSLISLESLRLIKKEIPQVKAMVNVSASTWNLPKRSLATRTFQAMLMASELDAVLLNPLDRELMATIVASQTMLGRDKDCVAYLAAHHAGRL